MGDKGPAVQCESCEDYVFSDDAHFKELPGATLAFCQSCSAPTRSQELGIGL